MRKELIEAIDTVTENICNFINIEFVPKEISYGELLDSLQDINKGLNDDNYNKVEIIKALAELLSARALIEGNIKNYHFSESDVTSKE